jgi:thioredoxin-like negative regulator of GroEL
MLGPALYLLAQASLFAGGSVAYEQAYHESQLRDRPLVVLVGADWCPGCRTMKYGVLPRVQASGSMGRVNYAEVDMDSEGSLAGRLMRGGTIPQLIVFSQGADGRWRREQITGAANPATVQSLIDRAVARQAQRQASPRAIGN